ncbi:hypothetical protein Ahy_A03g010402 [Arachis hypogaea]|uniref:Uncharacterized protein n=1 Tax=Arachis hypogaea TaxID=3818 RepID=A0A445DM63_ARAHY|nr:hypothetical protein Ahy_A03g010402 [Arachis hypogaea]
MHPWLKIDAFRTTYEHVIKLVNSKDYWVKTRLLSPEPPTIRRLAGHPMTKKENRTLLKTCVMEQRDKEHSRLLADHNAKTCKGPLRSKPHQRIRVMEVDLPLHQGHMRKYKSTLLPHPTKLPDVALATTPTPPQTLVLALRPSPPLTLTPPPIVPFAPVPRSLHSNQISRVSPETIATASSGTAARIFKFMLILRLKLQKKK